MSTLPPDPLAVSFESLAAATLDGLIQSDAQGRIVAISDRAGDLLGVNCQQALGQHWSRFFTAPSSVQDSLVAPVAQQKSPSPPALRTVDVSTAGRSVTGNVDLTVRSCAAGHLGGRLFFLRRANVDLAAEQNRSSGSRTTVRASEPELLLRMLLDSTMEGIYGANTEGLCTFANQACLRILGFERVDEVLGRNMHELIHSRHVDGRHYPVEECSIFLSHKTGQAMHAAEEVFWTKSGVAIPVEFWSYPIIDGDETRGVVVIFQNATLRRTAAEDKSRLAAIVDGTSDAIIGKSLNGQILTWNRGAEETYGYAAEEAIGKPISLILPAGQSLEEPELAEGILQSGGLRQFVTSRRRKDGRVITVSITASPIHDLSGQAIGTATIERDVTDTRIREQELLAAKETAEAANRIKSEFVANISHELRTPMNAILGMIDVVRRNEQLPSRLRDYLGTAHESARSMLSLVNDLLDFSRLDAGRFELVDAPFSLRDTLDEAMRVLALRARERGLELACHVQHDVPDELTGDARRLRQVVMNLVGNAIKFTPEGEVILRAAVESLEATQLQLHISVVDTGIGISPERRQEIFQPFIQVDNSDTRTYSGSGLGLTISKKIVELMGGRIWCESNPDAGMTFHVIVNLRVRQRQSRLEATTAAHLRNRSVLVIDRHQATREILTELVAAWGMSPHVISDDHKNTLELLDVAKQAGCEVIIMDAGVSDSEGRSLVDGLRQSGGLQQTILLVPPGEIGSEVVGHWQAAGAAALVEKPVSQSDLLEAIIQTLGEHSTVGTATWIAPISAAPRSLRLLVAEDIPANQKVVRSILELRGHTVEIASNGAEAVEQASRQRFDAILMDIRMPILSGIEATRKIRKLPDPRLSDVPIIALTAHVLQGDRKRCLQIGMNAFVTKPIDAEELIRSVEIVTASVEHGRRLQTTEAFDGPAVKSESRPMSPEPQVINLSQSLARLGGDKELLAEMANFFCEDVPQLYQSLNAALSEDDHEEATRSAHSIKGLASNFDAMALRDTAAKIEDACRTGRTTIARELIDRCGSEIENVITVLRREFNLSTPQGRRIKL